MILGRNIYSCLLAPIFRRRLAFIPVSQSVRVQSFQLHGRYASTARDRSDATKFKEPNGAAETQLESGEEAKGTSATASTPEKKRRRILKKAPAVDKPEGGESAEATNSKKEAQSRQEKGETKTPKKVTRKKKKDDGDIPQISPGGTEAARGTKKASPGQKRKPSSVETTEAEEPTGERDINTKATGPRRKSSQSKETAEHAFPLAKTLAKAKYNKPLKSSTLPGGKKTRYTRPQIVNPELCDDVLSYIGPTLEEYKGCIIVDMNPGAGLWSQKLHESLQPRKHILVEPNPEVYQDFLKKLLNKPGSKYTLTTKDLKFWDTHKEIVEEYIKPELEASDAGNTRILVTGSLITDPIIPGYGFTSLGKQIVFHFAENSLRRTEYFAFGPAKMLFWLPDREVRSLLPRTVTLQKKLSMSLNKLCNVTQIAGHDEPPGELKKGQDNISRAIYIDLKSVGHKLAVGKKNGFIVPDHRRGKYFDFGEDIFRMTGEHGALSPSQVDNYLLEQREKGKVIPPISCLKYTDLELLEKKFGVLKPAELTADTDEPTTNIAEMEASDEEVEDEEGIENSLLEATKDDVDEAEEISVKRGKKAKKGPKRPQKPELEAMASAIAHREKELGKLKLSMKRVAQLKELIAKYEASLEKKLEGRKKHSATRNLKLSKARLVPYEDIVNKFEAAGATVEVLTSQIEQLVALKRLCRKAGSYGDTTTSKSQTLTFMRYRQRMLDARFQVVNLGVEIYKTECEILKTEDPDKIQELESRLVELETEFETAKGKLTNAIKNKLDVEIDDRISIMSPKPPINWDARPFHPFVIHENEVYPNLPVALLDITPRPLPTDAGTDPVTEYEYYKDIIYPLCASPHQPLPAALEALSPGTSTVMKEVPALFDPAKGGRRNMELLRVRMLTPEVVSALAKGFREWMFKPVGANHPFYYRAKHSIGGFDVQRKALTWTRAIEEVTGEEGEEEEEIEGE